MAAAFSIATSATVATGSHPKKLPDRIAYRTPTRRSRARLPRGRDHRNHHRPNRGPPESSASHTLPDRPSAQPAQDSQEGRKSKAPPSPHPGGHLEITADRSLPDGPSGRCVTRAPPHGFPTRPSARSGRKPPGEFACCPGLTASRSLFRQGKDLDLEISGLRVYRIRAKQVSIPFSSGQGFAQGDRLMYLRPIQVLSRSLFRQGKDLDDIEKMLSKLSDCASRLDPFFVRARIWTGVCTAKLITSR